jgi:flagellar basal-body rod modification protein FlgD
MVPGIGSGSGSNNAFTNATSDGFVSKDTFLRLLITQLKNQDPLNPQESHEFVSQLAQFSSLEQMTNLSKSISSVLESSVTNLIGKSVAVIDSLGNEVTGRVDGIVYYSDGPAVSVGGNDYPLSAIQSVAL